jgi:tetratricopeptide (TPR) repeat protein
LVHADLEFRLQAGEAARVEEYLDRFPELRRDRGGALSLIAAEYALLCGRQGGCAAHDYVLRFPEYGDELPLRLAAAGGDPGRTGPAFPGSSTSADGKSAAEPPTRPPARGPHLPGYEVLEELGRGGMGVILRAHEPVLNRHLALKVLREEYRDRPELVRRFVEEAQIAGQLQHPGIVPIHELGRLPDGRPYFAMKLIKGQTLAELLRERPGPSADLPRFLAVFEQVCQALAYAHSRRVIHRDLKPANVMVGAFGEVQVMDWGLAKVLSDPSGAAGRPAPDESLASVVETIGSASGEPATEAGWVMGTLAYMPPEQARGETDRIDERADVFGLGAILCEVLTGAPPYTGTTGEVRAQAQLGHVRGACERLDGCGADAELVGLAKACLAARPEERPRDAGRVAQALGAYLAAVQEKLRAAQVERAAAEARAEADRRARQEAEARAAAELRAREQAQARAREERRRRRAQLALAAAVLALLLAAGGAGLWYQAERAREAARREYVNREATAALDAAEARRRELHGLLSDPLKVHVLLSDPSHWEAAVAAARASWRQARLLAESDPELLAPDVKRRLGQLDSLLQGDRPDYEVGAALDKVRQDVSTFAGGKLNFAAVARYEPIFAAAGLSVQTDPAELAERVRRSPLRFAWVAALDNWARVLPRTARPEEGKRLAARLLEVARRADPDGWRDRVRDPRTTPAALRQLARQVEVSGQSPQVLLLLASKLARSASSKADAAALLRRALLAYPQDFWLHFGLGDLAPAPAERAGCYQAAVAVRPRSSAAHNNWGIALAGQKDYAGAVAHYRQALRLDPKNAPAHDNWGVILAGQRHYAGAVAHYRKALDLDPKNALAHNNWGHALAEQKDYAGAVAHYRQALDLNPTLAMAHRNWGFALAEQKDYAGAVAHYRQALDLDPTLGNAHANAHNDWGNALREQRHYAGAVAHYRKALDLDPKFALAHNNWGLALAEQKDYAGAVAHYRKALDLDPTLALTQSNWGVALYARRDYAGAVAHYAEALRLDPTLAGAHCNWGRALADQKAYAGAVEHFRKALRLDPKLALAHHNLGLVLRDQRDVAGAVEHLSKALELEPKSAAAWADLGHVLQDGQGDAPAAARAFQRALELNPKDAQIWWNLGLCRRDERDPSAALAAFRKATALDPKFPNPHLDAAMALRDQGDFAAALAALQKGRELIPANDPLRAFSDGLVQECQRLQGVEKRLLDVLQGGKATPGERLDLADFCRRYKRWYDRVARLYAAAFAEQPALAEDLTRGHRYQAARAAVLAAAGRGRDTDQLSDQDRARLRRQALDWLHADLKQLARTVAPGQATARDSRSQPVSPPEKHSGTATAAAPAAILAALDRLQRWRTEPDLTSVREEKELTKLPSPEQQDWRRLWDEVRALEQHAHGSFTEKQLAGSLTARQKTQAHELQLQAGKAYAFDLTSKAFDPLLRLEDAKGTQLAENNDIEPGVDRNSRIVFTPERGGNYRLVATAFGGRGTGAYTLVIREFGGKR